YQPFPIEEWCYYKADRLIGVGYVDCLPSLDGASRPEGSGVTEPGGLSAIYFFWDPRERHRSLGTYNVLRVIDEARRRGLPFVYLGYFVEGCQSMQYKARFLPNEVRGPHGEWRRFRE
ncbi:MAG: hypothetical protein ACRD36_13320, partial [Candidatus Acidiferrum sp.]